MDAGTQQLYQCLASTLAPEKEARQGAEAALEAGAKQPGFGTALLRIVGAADVPQPMRQLAAVVLRKYVREHWTFESSAYREPPVGEEEKEAIRGALPGGLADPASKLRTAVALVIAAIARWDCPQQWPALLPGLLQAVGDGGNRALGERRPELADPPGPPCCPPHLASPHPTHPIRRPQPRARCSA